MMMEVVVGRGGGRFDQEGLREVGKALDGVGGFSLYVCMLW